MNKELAKTLTIALVNYIDENRPEGTMDCSSGECVSLEKAFTEENFDSVETLIKKKLSRLTEFEEGLVTFYNKRNEIPSDKDGVYNRHELEGFLHKSAKTLLALAKKELQPEIDAEIEKAYRTQDDVVFRKGWEQGKADALKDLPRWKPAARAYDGDRLPRIDWLLKRLVAKFEEGIFYLDMNDLYKLPGFNEEETTGGGFNTSSGTSTAIWHGNTSATDGKEHNPSFTH